MAALLFPPILPLPQSPGESDHPVTTTYSSQNAIDEQYFTPQLSIRSNRTSSDSTSTLSDHSSSDESCYDDFISATSTKHVHFASPPEPRINIEMKLENDEAEFFAFVSSDDSVNHIHDNKNNTNRSLRKRDKIRAVFNKKFHRSNHDISDVNPTEWNEVLARTLFSMHQDIEEIITGFDAIDQPMIDSLSMPDTAEPVLTTPRLSFRECQRGKLHLMRMAQMLHPPNLLTCDPKESPYPYTDIVEPNNFNLLRIKKNIPSENLLVQHRPFQHKKFRYRTQRCLLKMRHDINKLKRDVYGINTTKSQKELPSLDVQNYRNRLEKSLLEVRTQIYEYDRIHSSTIDRRQSISHVIAEMNGIDRHKKEQMEDYRTKLRPVEYMEKKQCNRLISAPFIPRRSRYQPHHINKENHDNQLIDTRFDPTTFVDLKKEAETFFDIDEPFWNRAHDSRSSISSTTSSSPRRRSNHFTLPTRPGLWDRLIYTFKFKQQMLRHIELTENDDDNSSNYTSASSQQRQSQSFSDNKQSSISLDQDESIEF